MSYKRIISEAIREALDGQGIEIPWAETDIAAEAVMEALDDFFEDAWRYSEVSD